MAENTTVIPPVVNESESDSISKSNNNEKIQSNNSDLEIGIIDITNESTILTGKKLAIVFVSLLMSLLLIALDQTILATALPVIASDFNSFTSQGWISSSFILTQTAFLLIWGQLLRIYPAKYALLFNILIFELGSIVCATAKSVNVLIFGRAFSGVGAAGLFVSMIQILSQVTRLEDRPKLFGLFGAVFGISSIIGPLMGGAFTDSVSLTWRWAFWINTPVGALTVIVVSLLLKASPPLGAKPEDQTRAAIIRQTLQMDWTAAVLILGMITALVYSLQTGGNTQPWNYYGVILSFIIAGLCLISLIFWEKRRGENAMVPPSIFKSRSIIAILAFSFSTRFCLLIFSYYIPIYYQAGRGQNAVQSGVALLPLMLSTVFSVIIGGQIVGRIGKYWHFLFFGPMFFCVGSGLLFTITENTPSANIIGYQILAGVGIGSTMQNALFAIQAEFSAPSEARLLAQATALTSFHQFLGGVIGLSIAEAVFSSELTKNLATYAPTAPVTLVQESPVLIYTLSPPALVASVVTAYVKSLDTVFILGVPIGILAITCTLFIKNIDIKKKSIENAKEGMDSPEEQKEQKVIEEGESS